MKRIIIFLLLNFAALGLGGLFTSKGVPSEWYIHLNKAPWTPPGWVFGAAWTLIMICFAFYMSSLWKYSVSKSLIIALYVIQLMLNISWNPIFFQFHDVLFGLIVITLLTLLIGFILVYYHSILKIKSTLIMPYFLWLLIATSLNAYILIYN
ncbi:MAG: TspO/MBR family protein [Bacteroidia bacterium]